MCLYTIGFAGKDARTFFGILRASGVKTLVDIRLNNTSQLSAYTKKNDLEFFLDAVAGIRYVHATEFAPTQDLLESARKRHLPRDEYEAAFRAILAERNPIARLRREDFEDACLLCSEPTAKDCHRGLVAEYLEKSWPGLVVRHL